MTTEDYISRILKIVTEIMYKNKELFPIVKDIFISANHYKVPEKELESYVRLTLELRIGLSYVVRNKIRCTDEIRWTVGNDNLEAVGVATVKSILWEYGQITMMSKELREKWNTIEIVI